MRRIRLTVAAALALLAVGAVFGSQDLRRDRTQVAAADRWDVTRLAVARESVASDLRFHRSLRWWTYGDGGTSVSESGRPVVVDGDAIAEAVVAAGPVVHIRGNLATTLRVAGQSEVVIGGSVLKEGRIEADGITAVHVQGNVDGTIGCTGMAVVWVGGDVHGEVLSGEPSMDLHVKGDLLGSVRPMSQAALLYIDAGGKAPSAVLAATDRYRYTELLIAVGSSDLAPGIHHLWTGTNGFVAVAEAGSAR